ncbi:hypothetical protein V2J09_007620 [Rumex salicifolius]
MPGVEREIAEVRRLRIAVDSDDTALLPRLIGDVGMFIGGEEIGDRPREKENLEKRRNFGRFLEGREIRKGRGRDRERLWRFDKSGVRFWREEEAIAIDGKVEALNKQAKERLFFGLL